MICAIRRDTPHYAIRRLIKSTIKGGFLLSIIFASLVASQNAFALPDLKLPWPSGYSHRINGGYTYGCGTHTGSNYYAIDFAFSNGDSVASVANGTVMTDVTNDPTAGNYLAIDHGGGYVSRYLHLNGWPSGIGVSTEVSQGQLIAYSDNTGSSSGPHLHFDLKLNGSAAKADPCCCPVILSV